MVLKKFTIAGALLAALASGYSVQAQVNVPSAEFEHRPLERPNSSRPFASPGVFDYDAQVFAPFEFTNDEQKDPNCGFFFTMDKTYTSVSRSGTDGDDDPFQSTGNHYLWGTRYEAGWMNDSDDGWQLGYQTSSGQYFTNGQDVVVDNPMTVGNRFATFEINRIFRQQLSQGGYFEPYIGFQYLNFNDKTTQDLSQTITGDVFTVDGVNRFKQEVDNNAFGLHAGARFNKRSGRWRFTTDGAIATTYNQQSYFATDLFRTGTFFTDGEFVFPDAVDIDESNATDQSFVPVLDLQFEMAYNISRDISLRLGVQTLFAFDGVARANTLLDSLNPNSVFGPGGPGAGIHNESYIASGFIFGFEWNR